MPQNISCIPRPKKYGSQCLENWMATSSFYSTLTGKKQHMLDVGVTHKCVDLTPCLLMHSFIPPTLWFFFSSFNRKAIMSHDPNTLPWPAFLRLNSSHLLITGSEWASTHSPTPAKEITALSHFLHQTEFLSRCWRHWGDWRHCHLPPPPGGG